MKFKSLLIAFIAVLAVSCGPTDPKEIIVKTWVLEGMDASAVIAKMPKENQPQFKKMLDDVNAKMKGKVTYEFSKDGKAKSYEPDNEEKWVTKEGTYKLSDDNKTITITQEGSPVEFTIDTLTNDKLSFSAREMKLKFIPKK